MSIISSQNVYAIIRKTLGIINSKIMQHGEVTGYILYKMLQCENKCGEQELVDYTMIAILHDLGMYKEGDIKDITSLDTQNVWPHSIYGFLFLKYLSPMGDKAEIVLYHHLDYNRYPFIHCEYLHILECLRVADRIDAYINSRSEKSEQDYFQKYRDIKFSGKALDLYNAAEKKYKIARKLADGSYKDELTELLSRKTFTEKYKKEFLEMLVYTIDFRSEHTVVHTMSTVHFAQQLGRLMKLGGMELRNLYFGALLHDLGKIAIPIEILESTGRLSDDEMKVMKAHVRITEMILEGIVDDAVLQIAVRHHEKLDGTGYHKGLSEKDLTIPQQIVAVADILSALYGKRSYKEAFDSDKIKAIINGDADNNKINKNAVACLMSNYNSVITSYEKEKDATIGLYLKIKEQFAEISQKFEGFSDMV